MGRAQIRCEEVRNVYKILVGHTEGKRLLCIPRHRWEGKIGVEFKVIVCEGFERTHLAQGRAQ
jgi:hypothetical protein